MDINFDNDDFLNDIEIHSEAFEIDFDDIGFDPVEDNGDDDEEMKEFFGM